MEGINRRGFLTGLGTLLATTAMVRPALPEDYSRIFFGVDPAIGADATAYWCAGNGTIFQGYMGEWRGISFIEETSSDLMEQIRPMLKAGTFAIRSASQIASPPESGS